MENKKWKQLGQSSRLVISILSGVLPVFLVWLVILGSSKASAQTKTHGVSSQPHRISSPSTINIEFSYTGDDHVGAATATGSFAGLLSQETGLDVQADYPVL